MLSFSSSHENRFLIAGLKVKKLPDWAARQAAYLGRSKGVFDQDQARIFNPSSSLCPGPSL